CEFAFSFDLDCGTYGIRTNAPKQSLGGRSQDNIRQIYHSTSQAQKVERGCFAVYSNGGFERCAIGRNIVEDDYEVKRFTLNLDVPHWFFGIGTPDERVGAGNTNSQLGPSLRCN